MFWAVGVYATNATVEFKTSDMKKHFQMASQPGDCNRCLECHCKTSKGDKCGQAYAPPCFDKNKWAQMGGPNHTCSDCHNGVKAFLMPGGVCVDSVTCGSCHRTSE